ncbi:hypothetical protein AgCh_016456 [Apium graveolens]
MAKYLRVVKRILTQFDEWYAEHIPREENTTTDALSHFSLFEIENYPRSIYFQVLNTPTIHVINLIAPVGVTSCWIDPIKTHLETGWIPGDAQEARKLSVRALRYSLIEGLLYKRSFVIPYLKCLRPLEAEETLKKSHEGICGQHLGGRALAHKIIRLGFYWPTMIADAKAYVKKYDRCQRHAPIAKALAKITTKQITQFFWENVIYRYGIPRILVTDNGKQFDNAEFRDYRDDNSIKLCFTSVAHPQENGHAEVANRIILDGFKKMVERSRNTWTEAVVPLEITHGSPMIEAYELETNEEGMRLALDLIDEVIDEASTRNAKHQRRASLYYNRRIKERFFYQEDLILRKIEASGVEEKEKLTPNWERPYKVKKILGRGSYKLETLSGDKVPHTWHVSNLKVYYV